MKRLKAPGYGPRFLKVPHILSSDEDTSSFIGGQQSTSESEEEQHDGNSVSLNESGKTESQGASHLSYEHEYDDGGPVFDDDGPVYDEVIAPGSPRVTHKSSDGSSTHLSELHENSSDGDGCLRCGDPSDWKNMVQCDFCDHFIHLYCLIPPLQTVPTGEFYCPYCIDQKTKLDAEACILQRATDDDAKGDTRPDDNKASDLISNDSFDESLIPTDSFETGWHESPLRATAMKINKTQLRNPLSYQSMKKWVYEGSGVSKELYNGILDAMGVHLKEKHLGLTADQHEYLRSVAPPIDIARSIRSCGDSGLKTCVLAHKFVKLKVCVYFTFNFRNPYDAAMDLYQSIHIRAKGPVYKWNTKFCGNGRIPPMEERVRQFAATIGFDPDDPSNLTIPVVLYSDETTSASGNVRFVPLWMHLALIDPEARRQIGDRAHSLVALLPDLTSLSYGFINESGEIIPDAAAEYVLTKENKSKALKMIQTKALRRFLVDWKANEADGMKYGSFLVRILLSAYLTDMKERRPLLGLKGDKWHCSHCYDFPGKNNETRLGARSLAQDKKLREEFTNRTRYVAGKRSFDQADFDDEHAKHGLRFVDHCPFTDSTASAIYLGDGPYNVFLFEPLHMKDGVLVYYMKFLERYLGGSFLNETQKFGNAYLGTKKFQMHIMEKGIESFHFVPLGLWFGEFERPLAQDLRTKVFLGSCELLMILWFLADPCPGFIMEDLKMCISRFKEHVYWLLNETESRETSKMHELFLHVADDITKGGLPSSFSADLEETFHELIKHMYTVSSRRRDGQAFSEMVNAHFYRKAFVEAEQLALEGFVPLSSHPWSPIAVFAVSRLYSSASSIPHPTLLLQENATRVAKHLFGWKVLPTDFIASFPIFGAKVDPFSYGNTWTMRIKCSIRQVDISPTRTAVVPGTNKGMFTIGKSFNVIAYKPKDLGCDPEGKEIDIQDAKCCRFHDPSFELFSSASRRKSTAYGIPLLFFNKSVWIWVLERGSSPTIPINEAVQHLRVSNELYCIDKEQVRGVSMATTHPIKKSTINGELFVFNAINCFGYNK